MFTIWLTTMALGAALVGSPPTSPSSSRLRPLDAVARATIDAGRGQSRTFADLVDAVDRSDFVVYVECSRSMSRELRGELVHGRSSPRVLRVRLRLTLALPERVAILAHELQHVREVIDSGIDNEPAAMGDLFARIGYMTHHILPGAVVYETAAALQVERGVANELRRPHLATDVRRGR